MNAKDRKTAGFLLLGMEHSPGRGELVDVSELPHAPTFPRQAPVSFPRDSMYSLNRFKSPSTR